MSSEEHITIDFDDGKKHHKVVVSKNDESTPLPTPSKIPMDLPPAEDFDEDQLNASTPATLTRALKRFSKRGVLSLWCSPKVWDKIVFDVLDLSAPLPREPVPWPKTKRE